MLMEAQLPAFLAEAFGWLEQTSFANVVRTIPRLYPILMSLHVLGIALMVGPTLALDFRLLGFGRNVVPVTVAMRYLLPLAHTGSAIILVTGVMMFAAIALTAGSSAAAPWKLGLIVLSGLNMLVFHAGVYRSVAHWDVHAPTPIRAKVAAVISAIAWTGVIFAGRFLAY